MMNMISSTSMTSMNGVVLMSIIGSADLGLVTDALIQFAPKLAASTAAGRRAGSGSEMKPIRAKPARCIV